MMSLPVPSHNDSDLRYLRRSFARHLAADGRSAATRAAYSAAVAQLETFLTNQRLPTTVMALRPPKVTLEQATNMAASLARGEPNRKRIGLTLFRDSISESAFPAADAGVAARVVGAVGSIIGRNKEKGEGPAESVADKEPGTDH